ncbi:hotdog family protein [Desulforhopalus singaporensis]|uniref:3-hydroxymyristoyl/3-hydroxydecanoyl-(Acyl carrier protein) dehydratase n=1 Tax=Desulforhopalus singaporensis TaxID=91360 RepID=A0A1H0T5H7_9BACT|nr:hypothetical protein [Desulforhopalus singaporensis]SDP49204.1 3-hydroxymyristoyl/3-hydroxydecanoyl-(acyl carrier protein) dehydratase [Desulforhopalus singaporensis]
MNTEGRAMVSLYRSLLSCCRGIDFAIGDLSGHAVFTFGPDYPGFEGHFPGAPILPAVVQLAAVRYVTGAVLGQEVRPVVYKRVKFRSGVSPDEQVVVRVQLQEEKKESWFVEFGIDKDNGEKIAGGEALFVSVEPRVD